ncbi:MAG: DMT family transporter [Bauldia sp.]|nr:MAG: DMT family transporter [Bauldia sp.]MBZ0228109.1 DMT family transporter [Bauldia sp.]
MAPPEHARPFVGIALKVASTIVFTAMATLVKLASARYPIGELVFFRSFFALIPVFAWVAWRGQFPSVFYTRRIRGHFFRSIAGATAMAFGFTALSLLPIADATAIGYASPLMTVVLAVLLLGEQVRIYRWSAVIVGLFGVIIILSDYVGPEASQVTKGSTIGAVVAVAGALTGALAATQVRVLVRHEGAATIVVYFSAFTALFALFTLPFGWGVPDAVDALILVVAGICGGLGQVFLTQSYRYGDASLIAPFDYTSMIWALVVSLVVFNTWPNLTMLTGTAIVVAAGLFVIWREHRLGIERTRSKRAQTPTTPLS